MKTQLSDATFEISYILLELGVLQPTRGKNTKGKKLTKNGVQHMKNDHSLLSFLLASQC